MDGHVRRIESIVPRKAVRFGGKARNLAALARAGFPVPAAFAVSADACDEVLAGTLSPLDMPEALLSAPARELGTDRLEELALRVRKAVIPRALRDALVSARQALIADGALAVAVRSSSLREDDTATSAAGLHPTRLGVADDEALEDAVREVWASLYSPRVLLYLRAHGVRTGVGIGVVLQAMVPADAAGVLFTVNPLSGDPGEMVINAAYGLGSTVVDGRVSPDTYRIDKATGWIRDRVIGDKRIAERWRAGAGLVTEEIDALRGAEEALPESLLDALVDLGVRIEGHFQDARDVEWALAGRALYVLQARPVTALPSARASRSRRARRVDRSRIVWSNVNVGEALPGVATPFTWSVLSGFSETGFRRAFGALGCVVPKGAELVGNFRGRIYLNMSEFMSIASQVPGLRPRTLLSLGGGGEIDRLELEVERRGSSGFLLRLPRTASRFMRENFALTERVARFERAFEDERRRIDSVDFRLLSATAVHRMLGDVERLLDSSGQVLLNVYGNLLASVVALRALVSAVCDEAETEATERALLTGLADVDSAAPGMELARIAEIARWDPPARAWLGANEPRALRVEDAPEGPTRRALEAFFLRFGDRGAREAEIAEPRWREDPTLPFATLRLHLLRESDGQSVLAVARKQREVREKAQTELEKKVPLPLRFAVRRLLGLVQHWMRMRERLRSRVVTVLGLYRELGLDASRRLSAMEPGCGEGGAFFLTVGELHAVLRGDVHSVASLIQTRRLQYARDASLPAPPDTFVGLPPPIELPADGDVLTGLGACRGSVVGVVRVVSDAANVGELAPGEILVTHQADVGWTPLFLAATAVVTDLGGPLSHASVVAREFGVPTVVNVKHGTQVLRNGDRIEVDGDRGTVRVLERAPR